ncbi:MAG TPA: pilus assembly protein N-terminal domain-containing protein [Terriglobales bacterium]|nr:pilus assembly protein N-terminal domain-containing protein [Terriglobales bacterium]
MKTRNVCLVISLLMLLTGTTVLDTSKADPVTPTLDQGFTTAPALVVPAPVVQSPLSSAATWKQPNKTSAQPLSKDAATKALENAPIVPVYQVTNSAPANATANPAPQAPQSVPVPAVQQEQLAQQAAPATIEQTPLTSTQPAITVTPQPAEPRKVEIPTPPLPSPSEPATQASDILTLPLNKTKSIDLSQDVRDVIIGNPEVTDIVVRSQKQVYLVGKAIGDTNVFLINNQNNLIRKIEIVVQADADGAQHSISTLLPGEHIEAAGMGDSIVLSGTASSDGAAAKARDIARRFVAKDENVVNMIRITNEQQVLLRVRVAEAQKTVLKELGVDNILSPTTLGPLTISAATSAIGLGPDIAGTLGLSIGNWDGNVRLLEEQGLIHTLAEPNLLAVSGEVASMLAGGEYPIPVPQGQNGIGIEYKPFGVSLSFLPVVVDGGRISIRISTEVSALSDTNSITIPTADGGGVEVKSFITRRANSVVELPSGGGLMIAGLMQNNIISGVNGVPGLMNIPILGALFHSTSFQRNETELVVLVQAILAKPVDPRQLALPTDGFAPSSDLDRYFLGHMQNLYAKKPNPDPNGPQSLQGPIGYIIQ